MSICTWSALLLVIALFSWECEALVVHHAQRLADRGVEEVDGEPAQPGCYMYMPEGCPDHPPFPQNEFVHDYYGERKLAALTDQRVCLEERRLVWASWCGKAPVRAVFVGSQGARLRAESAASDWTPPPGYDPKQDGPATVLKAGQPSQPGCYMRAKEGCPNHNNVKLTTWAHDFHGEKTACAAEDRDVCEVQRLQHYRTFCGTDVLEALFIPRPGEGEATASQPCAGAAAAASQPAPPTVAAPETPTQSGCYVWSPSGCPRYPKVSFKVWTHDIHGESTHDAGTNQTVCEVDRKAHYAKLCGVDDFQMQACFVPQGGRAKPCPRGTRKPGLPAPAPEGEGVKETGARAAESAPAGAAAVRKYVPSSTPSETIVVASAPVASLPAPPTAPTVSAVPTTPSQAGCYMWAPSGCPNHPQVGLWKWAHDFWGERNRAAGSDRQACEGERRSHYKGFCGVEDMQACFVPEGGRAEPCAVDRSFNADQLQPAAEPAAAIPTGSDPTLAAADAAAVPAPFAAATTPPALAVPTAANVGQLQPAVAPAAATVPAAVAAVPAPFAMADVQDPLVTPTASAAEWATAAAAQPALAAPTVANAGQLQPVALPAAATGATTTAAIPALIATADTQGQLVTPTASAAEWAGGAAAPTLAAPTAANAGQLQPAAPSPATTGAAASEAVPAPFATAVTVSPLATSMASAAEQVASSAAPALTGTTAANAGQLQPFAATAATVAAAVPTPFATAITPSPLATPGATATEWAAAAGAPALAAPTSAAQAGAPPSAPSSFQDASAVVEPDGARLASPGAVSALPGQPGCYIRSPVGCPNHPEFKLARWSHDYYGEKILAALTNQTACEVERKLHFVAFCGASQIEVVFVPGAGATDS